MSAQQQARERLLADRLSGIGGSDIHHVFNLEPYGCARQLVYEKRGHAPDHPFHGNNATERGTRLEDFAAEIYAEQTGRQIRRVAGGLTGAGKRDPEFPFMVCHSDREICNDPRGPGLLSVKVPGREMFHKIKYEGLPHSYTLQLQYEMALWGRSWGSYAIFWPDGWQLLPPFDVDRDNALVAEIAEGVKRLWALIDSDEPLPERLEANDRRCGRCPFRTTCQGDLMLAGAKDTQAEVPYDPSLADLIELLFEHQDIAEQADALLEETKEKIKAAMGGRGAVETCGARVYYRPQAGRETFQLKPYRKAHPELAGEMEKFTNHGAPFRSLRVYPR